MAPVQRPTVRAYAPPASAPSCWRTSSAAKRRRYSIGRHAGRALEEGSEEGGILVADRVGDALHRLAVALEHRLGGFDAHRLHIGAGQTAGRRLEAAQQGARRQADLLRELVQRRGLAIVRLQIELARADRRIVVRGRDRQERVSGLAGARHGQEQRLRRLHRDLVAAELFHEVEADIRRRRHPAAAQEPRILGDEHVGAPVHLRKPPRQVGAHGPVRRRHLAVEQPGFGEIRRAHADAGDVRAVGVLLLQPRQQRAVLQQLLIELEARCRHDDDVGALDVGDLVLGRHHQPGIGAAHGAAVDRRGRHLEARLGRLALQRPPQRPGRMEHLDRHERRGRMAVVQQDHRDVVHRALRSRPS